METKTLQILVSLSIDEIKNKLRVVDSGQAQRLLEVAYPLISAQALYEVSHID